MVWRRIGRVTRVNLSVLFLGGFSQCSGALGFPPKDTQPTRQDGLMLSPRDEMLLESCEAETPPHLFWVQWFRGPCSARYETQVSVQTLTSEVPNYFMNCQNIICCLRNIFEIVPKGQYFVSSFFVLFCGISGGT